VELRPNDTVDRYTVETKLGEGGLAVVYKVRHERLGTHHAMKVLKVATKSIQERLLLEGRVQARLHHPNVVSVTDIVDVADSPGLVMEFVEGASLDDLIVQERLDFAQIDELARGILRGVGAAHAAGLVHRDLKPANILLEIRDRRFVPKITDFGLAKMLAGDEAGGGSQTRTGMAMGTPAYMAPEQIESAKDVDARADVYSIGAILYELISGQRAYDDASMLKIFNAVVNADRVPLATHRPDAPQRWIEAVNAAMNVTRDERPRTCEDLLALWTGEAHLPRDEDSAWGAGMVERARTRGSGSSVAAPLGADAMPAQVEPAPPTVATPFEGPDPTPAPATLRVASRGSATTTGSGAGATVALGGAAIVFGVVMLMLATGISVAAVLWWTSSDDIETVVVAPPDPVVPTPQAPQPVTAPEPTIAPEPTVVPTPVAPVPVAPAPVVPSPVRPAPRPDPAPVVVAPAPDPVPVTGPGPADRAVGQVKVTGDAARVKLLRGSERFDVPGRVPAGEYRIEASFPGTSMADVGAVTVRAGATVTVDCDGAFALCQAR
jgi:tRNA A-37 threonylcarbamoyl transferase component Bud32